MPRVSGVVEKWGPYLSERQWESVRENYSREDIEDGVADDAVRCELLSLVQSSTVGGRVPHTSDSPSPSTLFLSSRPSSEHLCIGGFRSRSEADCFDVQIAVVSLKRINSIAILADFSNFGSDGIFGRDNWVTDPLPTLDTGQRWTVVVIVLATRLHQRTQILPEFLERRPPDKPPTVIDGVDRQVRS